ncbi:uncharacterized protein [Rutidosis leptorrhynchoides]|uniref:uncharacterized protein n=1 Tax=Rutidosis leptorrhynchoides TaxID=125765 RepID=UPI003A995A86
MPFSKTPELSGTSIIRYVDSVRTIDDVDVYPRIRHVSVQTGEEFSPEFLREREPRLDIPIIEESLQMYSNSYTPEKIDQHKRTTSGLPYNQSQQFVYEDANCCSEYNTNSSNSTLGKQFPIEIEKTAYPDTISGSYPGELKFLCSFGGKILPRPSDGKLRYVGGETRIISIKRIVNYNELVKKTSSIWNKPHTIKYQLPDEDLDALISVCSSDDFHHMVEEYHELEQGSQRLRIFLVALNDSGSPFSFDSRPGEQTDSEYEYVIAINGLTGLNFKKCLNKESLDGGMREFITPGVPSKVTDKTDLQGVNQTLYENAYQVDQISQQMDIYSVESGCENCPELNRQYMVWEEDMIKWTETDDSNLTCDLELQENQYAKSASNNDIISNISSTLDHTNSQNLGLINMTGEIDCILSSNLNVTQEFRIPNSAIFAPVSCDVSLVESFEDNLGGQSVSLTSDDKNADDIPRFPVLVEDVTDNLDNLTPGILSSTIPVQCIQEEPRSEGAIPFNNQDSAYDKKPKNKLIGTAIAEVEAGMHGLQIIKNADLEELHELGSGTFGTVYHGKWRGTDVAIKRIRKSCFAGKSSEQERLTKDFWREAQMLSNLHHPNVVALYGVVPDGPGGTLSTVTEYMTNGSLRHALMKNNRALGWRKKLIITQDAAIGMEYLHFKNIIHFDLKCENLLVNLGDPQRPICKVGDFGLSRIKRNTLVSGGVRGTLPWMAPELLNGSSTRVCEKVDVFSFGIVMWEILTEEEPYADMHCGAIIGGIVSNMLRPPIPEGCDCRWKVLMEECWSHDPADRPTFTEITNKLQAISVSQHSKKPSNVKDDTLKSL